MPKVYEMPRFDDGTVNVQGLIRIMTEPISTRSWAFRQGTRARTSTRETATAARPRDERRRDSSAHPEGRARQLLPGGPFVCHSRVDRAVIVAISEMVTSDVSTKEVERAATAFRIGFTGKSRVSRIRESLDDIVSDIRSRGLSEAAFPYTWGDAAYVKCKDDSHVSSYALVTVIGTGLDGYRYLLDIEAVGTESQAG